MPLQRPLNINQTPLILTLGLAQRHQEILLARLLLVRRTLSLRHFLFLALRSRGLVIRLAIALRHGNLFFFSVLLAEGCRGLDSLGGDGFVGVALGEELCAFVGGQGGGYGAGFL